MRVEVAPRRVESLSGGTLALPATADGASGSAARLDGRIAVLFTEGELRGEPGEIVVLHGDGEVGARRVVAAGVGRADDPDHLRTAAAAAAKSLDRVGGTLAWALDPDLPIGLPEQARAVVEGVVLGSYDPGIRKTGERRRAPDTLVLLTDDATDEVQETARRAAVVADWANRARDLANAPANELTPAALADRAVEFAAGLDHLEATVLGPDEIEELGMGAFAGVAAGSHNPARLIVLRYDSPGSAEDTVLGLVGKAVTFDAGGISIKKALYMEDMKGDMAGGGSVITGLAAIAELGLPVRAIGVVAATENMVGGGSFRPGDILRAANGKTIEIVNTDAEGRLILADALWYARREGATHLVDFATLTGIMEKAMGDLYAGVFGTPEGWRDEVVAAGEASGDHAWPWPLHPRYRRYVDSDFADLKNSSVRGQASPAYAAEFLREFAGDGPWAHVDMAGTGFFTWPRTDYLWQRGGTGYGVRLIVELAQNLASRGSGLAGDAHAEPFVSVTESESG
ncbi:MAG: M17 family metallopeptidase [Gaiellaceae bacterium]